MSEESQLIQKIANTWSLLQLAELLPGNPTYEKIKNITGVWETLCQQGLYITVVPPQNPADFFRAELFFQISEAWQNYNKVNEAEEYLSRALILNNFNALRKQTDNLLAKQEFNEALRYAKIAAVHYLSPGYLLIAQVYHQIASRNSLVSQEDKKTNIMQALINIKVAKQLSLFSAIALANTGGDVSEAMITSFEKICAKQIKLTANDQLIINDQVTNIVNKLINLDDLYEPSSPASRPSD